MACANSDKTKITREPPLGLVEFPDRPWERVAIDILGPISRLGVRSKFILVLVDHHTKWFVFKAVSEVNSSCVIEFLESIFFLRRNSKVYCDR